MMRCRILHFKFIRTITTMSSFRDTISFNSRRSAVLSINGIAASSQPLASRIGLQILKHGGNAADAAIAIAAALNVTEPCSTGIGGDAFCLYYDAQNRTVQGLNGRFVLCLDRIMFVEE